jgi:hypothetical protein
LSALRTQQDILDAEFLWHGGYLSAPKVYDSGTSFSAPPTLRHSEDGRASESGSTSLRRIKVEITEEAWTVEFDAP